MSDSSTTLGVVRPNSGNRASGDAGVRGAGAVQNRAAGAISKSSCENGHLVITGTPGSAPGGRGYFPRPGAVQIRADKYEFYTRLPDMEARFLRRVRESHVATHTPATDIRG